MPKKPKKPRIPTQIEVWKGIRKGPTPPGRIHQPRNRQIEQEDDEKEMAEWLGWRGEDYEEFEDE